MVPIGIHFLTEEIPVVAAEPELRISCRVTVMVMLGAGGKIRRGGGVLYIFLSQNRSSLKKDYL